MINEVIVNKFLNCYKEHDYKGMHECLDNRVIFSDFAFKKIIGSQVRAMWHWYCIPYSTREKAVNVLNHEVLRTSDNIVYSKYRVSYLLGNKKRKVEYNIAAEFTLKDNKIISQKDVFKDISQQDFTKMAFGNPFLPRFLVRIAAMKKLRNFITENSY